MATIQKRGDYQWLVRIRRKDHAPINRTFDTYEDAKEFADITEGRISGQEYVDKTKEQRSTLKQLLQRYLEEVTPTKKGARQEANRLNAWMAEDMATWSLLAISSTDIADWRKAREKEGKAPSTISNAMNLLSAVYRVAISEWGYRVENPVRGVARPKARPARWATLTTDDEIKLLDACRKGPSWLVWCVRLALTTAMRAGEIRSLTWAHVHPTHVHLPATKNDSTRDVPLTHAASAVIEEMRKALPRRIDGQVFDITPDMLSQAFRDAAKKAEVAITFHDLRHIATTRLAPLHRDPLELAATTGHKTLNVLRKYYNPTPADRAADLRRRETAVHNPPKKR